MIEDWLTVDYHPIWDLVRLTQVTLAVIVMLWLVRVAVTRHKHHPQDEFTRFAFMGMTTAAGLGVFQALDSMGEELIVWRAPLFLIMLFLFWRAVSCKL